MSLKGLQRISGLSSLLDFFSAEDLFHGIVTVWDVLYRIYETFLHNNAIISCSGHNSPVCNGMNGNISVILENDNYCNIYVNRSGHNTPRKSNKIDNDTNSINENNEKKNNSNDKNKKNNKNEKNKLNYNNDFSQYYTDDCRFDMINNPIFVDEDVDLMINNINNYNDKNNLSHSLSPRNRMRDKNKNVNENETEKKCNNDVNHNDNQNHNRNNNNNNDNNDSDADDDDDDDDDEDHDDDHDDDHGINNSNNDNDNDKNNNNNNKDNVNIQKEKNKKIDQNKTQKINPADPLSENVKSNMNKFKNIPISNKSNITDLRSSDSIEIETDEDEIKFTRGDKNKINDISKNNTMHNNNNSNDNNNDNGYDDYKNENNDISNNHDNSDENDKDIDINNNINDNQLVNKSKMNRISLMPDSFLNLTVSTKNVPHHMTEERSLIIPPPRSPIVREERSLCNSALPPPRSPTIITLLTPLIVRSINSTDYSGSKKRLSNDENKRNKEIQIEKLFHTSNDSYNSKNGQGCPSIDIDGEEGSDQGSDKSVDITPIKSPNGDLTDRERGGNGDDDESDEDTEKEIKNSKNNEKNGKERKSSNFSLDSIESIISVSPSSPTPSFSSSALALFTPICLSIIPTSPI